MNLRSVRIGTRLGIGFGIILVLLLAVVGIDIVASTASRHAAAEGMRHANAKAVVAGTMRSAILEGGIAMRNVGLQYSTPEMEREEAKLLVQRKRFKEASEKLTALGLAPEEKALLQGIEALDAQTEAPFRQAIEKVKEYANEAAGKLISSEVDPLNQKAILEIDKLVDMQQAE
ncbi:MAG TPA: MCP four helix bundle domain-containing protein, partial [Noviherbaspirillum sp.]|nr:MCP four helix bundle domain-containing protein [Noviherbaspirillum sp.]